MAVANNESLRLQIMNAIVASYAAMSEDMPVDDPYGLDFSTAELGPLGDWDARKRYALGVVAGPEKTTYAYPYEVNFLTINVEFKATINRGDDAPAVIIERVLTAVKRRAVEDRTWGGLALDTKIVGSEIDLLTYADRSANGVCLLEVQYRHYHLDPRNPNPSP